VKTRTPIPLSKISSVSVAIRIKKGINTGSGMFLMEYLAFQAGVEIIIMIGFFV
jgi:hypothetical protein